MKVRIALAALSAVSLAACGHMGMHHQVDNAAAVAARQNAMKAIAAASGPLRSPTLDAATARSAGKTINDNLKIFAANLPKGSGPESGVATKARSEIWSGSDSFNNALNAGLNASEALARTNGDAAAIQVQAKAMMQACGGCHTNYRS